MLENQFVQKSSETSDVQSSVDNHVEVHGKIYFDTVQAIAEFDNEVEAEQIPEQRITDPRVQAFVQNAQVLMKHREFALAMNLLREASNKDSKNPATLNLLAQCLERMGRASEALVARKALMQSDYGFESVHGYATALYKMGKDQEALDKYYEALSVLTQENEVLFECYKNMGNIFVRQGDFEAAEEYYNKAYTLNSRSDILLVNFGTLEVQRNDFDKSLYCFRKAVEINPRNDKAWIGLGMVHNHFCDNELAWANIESALEINPRNRTGVHLAANWAQRDGKLQKAIELLQAYLGEVEEDEDMSLVLINLLCAAGQVDTAVLEMERVLLWNPDHKEVRELKKKILTSQKVA